MNLSEFLLVVIGTELFAGAVGYQTGSDSRFNECKTLQATEFRQKAYDCKLTERVGP